MSQAHRGGGSRSRIVVDVARVQAEAQSSRKGGRRRRALSIAALVVGALLLILLVGSYTWWQSYKRGPAYSLALLVDAAQRDDLPAVEAMIDGDQVAQGFIPQVIEKLTGAGATLPPEARARATAALPQLLPRVRETIREEVARGVKEAAGQTGARYPFFILALGIPRAADVRETGDAAAVKFNRGDQQTELSMQRSGDTWKVVNVKDDELAGRLATRLAASLPTGPPPGPQRRQGR
ncbi:MAG TPA: hypothetical protein VGX48_16550 [Pyrinomonadaceae bacterium]|jgi:uncharacterized membrane protein|nr:hypothetical protein [Pyrinomonadaceae bacterium]